MSKRKYIFPFLPLIAIGALLVCLAVIQVSHVKEWDLRTHSIYQVPLRTREGLPLQLPRGKFVILVYFQPDCDLCKHQFMEIASHQDHLNNALVIFTSDAPAAEIGKFVTQHTPLEKSGIVFCQMNSELLSMFAARSVPHILVFGGDGRLRMEFRREVRVEELIRYVL